MCMWILLWHDFIPVSHCLKPCPSLVSYPPLAAHKRATLAQNAVLGLGLGLVLSDSKFWILKELVWSLVIRISKVTADEWRRSFPPLRPAFHTFCTALHLFSRFSCKFFSLTETPENYTVVLDEEGFKGKKLLFSTYLWKVSALVPWCGSVWRSRIKQSRGPLSNSRKWYKWWNGLREPKADLRKLRLNSDFETWGEFCSKFTIEGQFSKHRVQPCDLWRDVFRVVPADLS